MGIDHALIITLLLPNGPSDHINNRKSTPMKNQKLYHCAKLVTLCLQHPH